MDINLEVLTPFILALMLWILIFGILINESIKITVKGKWIYLFCLSIIFLFLEQKYLLSYFQEKIKTPSHTFLESFFIWSIMFLPFCMSLFIGFLLSKFQNIKNIKLSNQ